MLKKLLVYFILKKMERHNMQTCCTSQVEWHTFNFQSLGGETDRPLWVQSVLHRKSQASQGHLLKHCLKNKQTTTRSNLPLLNKTDERFKNREARGSSHPLQSWKERNCGALHVVLWCAERVVVPNVIGPESAGYIFRQGNFFTSLCFTFFKNLDGYSSRCDEH